MADSTSSARQEAERLVATVLAMAAQSGLGRRRPRPRRGRSGYVRTGRAG